MELATVNAAEALKAARAAGVKIRLDGDDLVLAAVAPPPTAVLNLLSFHKAEVVALLRPRDGAWSVEDWLVFFEERAGIAEFRGGLPGEKAEARAFACCAVEWLNRNFVRSQPGRCLGCCGGDSAHDPLLPHGVESTGHAWLHSRCWAAWHAARNAEAVAALEAMGIKSPPGFPNDFGKNRRA
jgi:hypothetical protein